MIIRLLAAAAGAALLVANGAAADAPPPDHPVIELRQYKIVPGARDAMIGLFERRFVESQEDLGTRLVGQFRDTQDPNRFTWIRGFPDMTARAKVLQSFYYGPVWQAYRGEANPLLDDNDNVLLLRPAAADEAFAPLAGTRAEAEHRPPSPGLVVATIYYLWKAPDSGFVAFFHDKLAPTFRHAGLPVLGAYVPEEQPNNFPRLVVRQGERLLVWFTRVDGQDAYDRSMRALTSSPAWRSEIAPALADYQERAPQVLRLAPTPRSTLR